MEDEWIIEPVDTSQDEYWRVGELIRIKNKLNSSYLCSHKRKIKENDDYEVYGLKSKTDINTSSPELKTKSSK